MGCTRRELIRTASTAAVSASIGAAVGSVFRGLEEPRPSAAGSVAGGSPQARNEEYVWLSANVNLPLFVAHDHVALRQVAEELGVTVTIAGPEGVDIPSLVAAVEQTTARRPTGMMVCGWEPSALVPPINRAIESGIPVVCVDGDVPASKRISFIGTNWYDLGVQQGKVMLDVLKGRKGKVAMLGLIEQHIDQQAFEGFRSVVVPAGLNVLDPQQDKGNQAEAAKVASALLRAHPDLIGMAGFDSESGPGLALAIKEAGRKGTIVATCVEAEPQHLRFVKEGILSAAIGQKRELFTYQGVKALFEIVHSPLKFSSDDKAAGVSPVPVIYNTGTYTVTPNNVDLFLRS